MVEQYPPYKFFCRNTINIDFYVVSFINRIMPRHHKSQAMHMCRSRARYYSIQDKFPEHSAAFYQRLQVALPQYRRSLLFSTGHYKSFRLRLMQ